ncbi:peptidylprolyl isomerase [Rhodopila sp.]|jgi:peptidyl-prolyl cis-trans isomerase SurA|uniref:peptidylprolyl isomerase n=1 Tax=Rhodopila sp. TaxID=2480087 RepID=UPI002C9C9646|nr:peptidylprolyl isomerase [Rhodopila sp.]HVZ08585.1 peptidylprolyl isomerase [Rhodopila sp.]
MPAAIRIRLRHSGRGRPSVPRPGVPRPGLLSPLRPGLRAALLTAGILVTAGGALAASPPRAPAGKPAAAQANPGAIRPDAMRIAAVVNGDVITSADIEARTRLFAMSTGLPLSPDVLGRLRPQILRQLVDERLRMQEALRRKIIVQDQQIADAIREIEQRNGLGEGMLRAKLAADGVSFRTMVDQVRSQLAWGEVLRQVMGERGGISPADVAERQKMMQQMVGQTQYHLGEIFIPIDDPANAADAERFAETVIHELRSGAPFAIVAAQFSQTPNALEGGEMGWLEANQLDQAILPLANQMPVGAISNPVRVPGGIMIVQMRGRREIGREMGTVVAVRQAFLPFTSLLTDPTKPTDQQRQTLNRAREIAGAVHGCDAMEQYAKANKLDAHGVDPGDVRLEAVNPPQFRQMLATIPIGKVSEPLVSREGITVMVVCSREEKNLAAISKEDAERLVINERVELLSRQVMRDLHRQANIDLRGNV